MSNGLSIRVRDLVSGYCPACRSPRIELVYDTSIGSNGCYERQVYILRCEHQDVCMYRREYKEGE